MRRCAEESGRSPTVEAATIGSFAIEAVLAAAINQPAKFRDSRMLEERKN